MAEDGQEGPDSERTAPFDRIDDAASARKPLRYAVPSAWLGHVPFAMALVPMASPRILVELGTHSGVSYCAFCQAVKESGSGTKCFAVDTWKGDEHASYYDESIYTELKSYHDPLYGSFSTLIRSSFDEALDRFDDATIDILHIDGFHAFEAVEHDFRTWLPKLSDRGIVLFHDTNVRSDPTFGVWRLWDTLKADYPHLEFLHSYGLGVLAVGPEIPERARPLFAPSPGSTAAIRAYFALQGDRLCEIRDLEASRDRLAAELDGLKVTEAELRSSLAKALHESERLAGIARDQDPKHRLRYRAVDHLIDVVDKMPFVSRMLRFLANRLRGKVYP